MCDLEGNIYYYRARADRFKTLFVRIRFTLLISVVLEGFLLYWGTTTDLAFYFAIAFGMVIAALALWDALTNYAETAAILRFAVESCSELQFQTEKLWRDIETYAINRNDAEKEYARICERWSLADAKVTITEDSRLYAQCSRDADAAIQGRYAT